MIIWSLVRNGFSLILTGRSVQAHDLRLPVCEGHEDLLGYGTYVLCPPLNDVKILREWEIQDWHSRVTSEAYRDRSVPPLDVSPSIILCEVALPSSPQCLPEAERSNFSGVDSTSSQRIYPYQ